MNNVINRISRFRIFSRFPVVGSFSDGRLDLEFSCPYSQQNRRKFMASLGIDYYNLVCAGQVHKAGVVEVRREDRGRIFADTDSLITKSNDVAIAVFTADCLSVFIYDTGNKAVGLVHAGWRGTKDKIVKKTVEMMGRTFGSKAEDLVCAFGPAIRSCCYEIGPEVGDYFPESLIVRNKKLYLDLSAINKKQLFDLGLNDGQIEDSNICTSCSKGGFFSYRREKDKAGRMMSVMMLN